MSKNKELKLPSGIKFEATEPGIYFKCKAAVFPVGGVSSLCYTTSLELAELIARELNTLQAIRDAYENYKGAQ